MESSVGNFSIGRIIACFLLDGVSKSIPEVTVHTTWAVPATTKVQLLLSFEVTQLQRR